MVGNDESDWGTRVELRGKGDTRLTSKWDARVVTVHG